MIMYCVGDGVVGLRHAVGRCKAGSRLGCNCADAEPFDVWKQSHAKKSYPKSETLSETKMLSTSMTQRRGGLNSLYRTELVDA